MKPSELFGVFLRLIGLGLILQGLWVILFGLYHFRLLSPIVLLMSVGIIIIGLLIIRLGVWFLQGAPALIRFAYPSEGASDQNQTIPQTPK